MAVKTLNSVIEKLSSHQQNMLVYLVRETTKRKNFHRGLLPFLPADEAARALKGGIELSKGTTDDPDKTLMGLRAIRRIESILTDVLPDKLYEDEASVNMFLSDAKLVMAYGNRVTKKFSIMLKQDGEWKYMTQLEWIKPNYWKVTTHKDNLEHVTTVLAESAR